MLPKDFVYNQIYKGALGKGASEAFAHQRATMGVNNYLKGNFKGKAINFVESEIKEAVRLTKLAAPKKRR